MRRAAKGISLGALATRGGTQARGNPVTDPTGTLGVLNSTMADNLSVDGGRPHADGEARVAPIR
jgi:hypothetical protein